MYTLGLIETIVFNILAFLVLVCYMLSVVIAPGSIPDSSEWQYTASIENNQPIAVQTALETKQDGERRHCKWCGKYKPDRCHHCRQCRSCVLRMDHHCPWIYNCVGLHNHKFFMLLLFYATVTTAFVSITMGWTVYDVITGPGELGEMFLILTGETLSALLALITSCFFGFHVWLTVTGMSTIEFCEKSGKDW